MRLIITVSLIFLFSLTAISQDKLRFNSRNFIGLLEGESGSAFQLLSVNGITYKKYFAGLGTGLDYYGSRSVPLFASLSADLSKKPRTFFISASAGLNFVWKQETGIDWNIISRKTDPGYYGAGHFGYRIPAKGGKDAFMLSIGYSYKHFKEKVETRVFCVNPPCDLFSEYYNHYFRRLSVLLGWQF